jgi:hypothetical protein
MRNWERVLCCSEKAKRGFEVITENTARLIQTVVSEEIDDAGYAAFLCTCTCRNNGTKQTRLDDNRFPKQQGAGIFLYFYLN